MKKKTKEENDKSTIREEAKVKAKKASGYTNVSLLEIIVGDE